MEEYIEFYPRNIIVSWGCCCEQVVIEDAEMVRERMLKWISHNCVTIISTEQSDFVVPDDENGWLLRTRGRLIRDSYFRVWYKRLKIIRINT